MLPTLTQKALIALFIATASVPTAFAICNAGEVAIGIEQLCTINGMNPVCGAEAGEIYSSDCQTISSTPDGGFCNGGFSNGWVVNCDQVNDAGNVLSVVDVAGGIVCKFCLSLSLLGELIL